MDIDPSGHSNWRNQPGIIDHDSAEVLFDGIRYSRSSSFDLIFGGLATFLAAGLAGFIARKIIRVNAVIVVFVLTVLISLETVYLILNKVSGDPVWFDLLAAAGLIGGIWLGFNYRELFGKTILNARKTMHT